MKKKDGKDKTIGRIKTGALERQWQMTRAGVTAGSKAGAQMWGSVFLGKEKRQARNSRILSQQAHYLADELGKLKGSVVKIGQMIALYGEHVLPEEVTTALRTLEEQTTALAWPAIEKVLRQELGQRIDDFIIEKQPIGAASLAQVHRAEHRATGRQLCLKIQYPGVADAIDSDFDSVVRLLRLGRLLSADDTVQDWLEEVRSLLHHEVDYRREADMTRRFAAYLAHDPVLKVPQVIDEYCSGRLLVSTFEAGVAVSDVSVAAFSQVQRNALGRAFLQLFLRELFEWGQLQTDPNFGNYRIRLNDQGDGEIVLLDFGSVVDYDDGFLRPVRAMLLGAYRNDLAAVRQGAIDLGIMQVHYPDDVHQDFAALCCLLMEPFIHQRNGCPPEAVNAAGEYRWEQSRLPRRAGKLAAKSAMSRYFAVPPKEFVFLSRKLLGVFSFIAALGAEFNPDGMLDAYLD
ncbi:MAG TPA: AarF/ABC1/UbiB kinase family protein [Pseudomonadales bacterium]